MIYQHNHDMCTTRTNSQALHDFTSAAASQDGTTSTTTTTTTAALQAVVAAVASMEDNNMFNAGKPAYCSLYSSDAETRLLVFEPSRAESLAKRARAELGLNVL